MAAWPARSQELVALQERLGGERPEPWRRGPGRRGPGRREPPLRVAGCFVCFPFDAPGRGGRGDTAWAAAAVLEPDREPRTATVEGETGGPYLPGLLALRAG